MTVESAPNPILQAPRPFFHQETGVSWRWLHGAVGQEMFGRPAGPWGILFAPVPLVAAMAGLLAASVPAGALDAWFVARVGELAWLAFVPFLVAVGYQALVRAASERLWRRSEGEHHLDYSPRVWHYHLGLVVALLPLILLQCSESFLDLYLRFGLTLHTLLGSMKVPIAGYDPGPVHLMALLILPAVHWQVRRVVVKIPCGRMLGLQRELARLRGSVAWQAEAWELTVAETFDRWLGDLSPRERGRGMMGERQRQHRQRWSGLRKEIVASWAGGPPDLARANRALHLYRQGW